MRCLKGLRNANIKEEERSSIAILEHALTESLRQIAVNAGQEASVVLNKVMANWKSIFFLTVMRNTAVTGRTFPAACLGERSINGRRRVQRLPHS